MVRGTLLLTCAVVVAIAAVPVAASEPPVGSGLSAQDALVTPRAFEHAKQFRQDFGLDASDSVIEAAAEDGTTYSDSHWGLPLTPAESAEVSRRDGIALSIDGASSWASQRSGFGGVYLDQVTGDPVFSFLDPDETDQEELADRLPASVHFVVRQVALAISALQQETNDLLAADDELEADGVILTKLGIDLVDNVVQVGVASDVEAARSAMQQYAKDISVESDAIAVSDSCAVQPPGYPGVNFKCGSLPLKGGLELEVQGNRYPWCTAGFLAKNTETGAYGIITAGHCLYGHAGDTWYHDTSTIGPQRVSVWTGTHDDPGTADVGFIAIEDNGDMGDRNAILYNYPSSVDNIVGTKSLGQQYAGEAVCRTGINYGYDCGAIAQVGVLRKSVAFGITHWIANTIEVDFDSSGGDSGGPITMSCCANTTPPYVNTYAMGTHVHSDPDTDPDPHGWYSPIDQDIAALDAAAYTYLVCVTSTC